MADGKTEKDKTESEIVARVLAENAQDAERLLAVLVETLVYRHIDCELRKMGRRDAWTPGNERLNALTAAFDTLYQLQAIDAEKLKASGEKETPHQHELREARQSLIEMLISSQFLAERRANIIDDDGEEKPIMRLVTD